MAQNGGYRDVILDQTGVPISGVTVTVKLTGTGTSATLYSDRAGTAKNNPFINDNDGFFEFFADTGHTFDITFAKTGVTFTAAEGVDVAVDLGATPLASGILAAGAVLGANNFTGAQKVTAGPPNIVLDNTSPKKDTIQFKTDGTSTGYFGWDPATGMATLYELDGTTVIASWHLATGNWAHPLGKLTAGFVPAEFLTAHDGTTRIFDTANKMLVVTVPIGLLSAAAANSGYPMSGTGGETLRIIRGCFVPGVSPTVSLGTGWSIAHNSTGHYTLTFTTAFASAPSITLTIATVGNYVVAETTAAGSVTIKVTNDPGGSGNVVDTDTGTLIHFIAIGPA